MTSLNQQFLTLESFTFLSKFVKHANNVPKLPGVYYVWSAQNPIYF